MILVTLDLTPRGRGILEVEVVQHQRTLPDHRLGRIRLEGQVVQPVLYDELEKGDLARGRQQ